MHAGLTLAFLFNSIQINKLNFIFITYFIYAYTCVGAHKSESCVEFRGQLVEATLLSLFGAQGLNSHHQVWSQALFPLEPFCYNVN